MPADTRLSPVSAGISRPPMHVSEGSVTKWRPWFAWHPVKLYEVDEVVPYWYHRTGPWAWLRRVERRTFYAAPWFVIWKWEEYREKPHV
jgi:hypothetical protein